MTPANRKHSALKTEGVELHVTARSILVPLVCSAQGHNAPADRVPANWMERGYVQKLEVIEQTMMLQVHPIKNTPERMYQYWTTNPLLQIQLFAAYLCDFVVDLFSVAPEGPSDGSFKNGGEILTMSVDLGTDQSCSSHQDSTKKIP